jgi:hypothetical protein
MSETKTETYRDWTIRIEPGNPEFSKYKMTLINPEGKEVAHDDRAGTEEDIVFEQGRKMVDMEIEAQTL